LQASIVAIAIVITGVSIDRILTTTYLAYHYQEKKSNNK